MGERVIMHIDMDAYFASIEQAVNPSLKGKPIAVIGSAKRTVITTASYEARRYGVKTGMNVYEGRKMCPHLIFIVGNNRRYTHTSANIVKIFKKYTPIVEVYSIDEAFLDVTGSLRLFSGINNIVRGIKREIKDMFDITCSIGVAPNKLLAKLGSGMKKPDGLTVIRDEDVRGLLENMPVDKLCGIGRKTKGHLNEYGIVTLGELARFPVSVLKKRFGIVGEQLHHMALGIDDREVVPLTEHDVVRSIGHSSTLNEDVTSRDEIRRQILRLSEMVGRRARRHKYTGRTVHLQLRYNDFTTFSRQRSIKNNIDQGHEICEVASGIFDGIRLKLPIRLVGVTLTNLTRHTCQLELFEQKRRKAMAIEAMDEINDRYGEFFITYGKLLHCQKHARVISPSYRPEGPQNIDVT